MGSTQQTLFSMLQTLASDTPSQTNSIFQGVFTLSVEEAIPNIPANWKISLNDEQYIRRIGDAQNLYICNKDLSIEIDADPIFCTKNNDSKQVFIVVPDSAFANGAIVFSSETLTSNQQEQLTPQITQIRTK